MDYNGKYAIFDPGRINTYPLKNRENKVKLEDTVSPSDVNKIRFNSQKVG